MLLFIINIIAPKDICYYLSF